MTDKLPGLPSAPPLPADPLTPLDNAMADLSAAVIEVVMHARAETPNVGPADTVSLIVEAVADAVRPLMGANQLRTGLLSAFERSHTEPMSFIDVARTKKALELMADRRRSEIKTTASGLILPGKE